VRWLPLLCLARDRKKAINAATTTMMAPIQNHVVDEADEVCLFAGAGVTVVVVVPDGDGAGGGVGGEVGGVAGLLDGGVLVVGLGDGTTVAGCAPSSSSSSRSAAGISSGASGSAVGVAPRPSRTLSRAKRPNRRSR